MKNNFSLKSVIQIIGILLIPCLPVFGQIDENYSENLKKAFVASSIDEYQSSLKFCKEVLKVTPNHPRMNYLTARLYEQLGKSDSALKYLKKATKLGYTSKIRWFKIHPLNDPIFSSLRERKEFKEIIQSMNIYDKPIQKSQIAFIVTDKRLGYYEGISYDPLEKVFFLGSDNKIFKVDHFGKSTVFTKKAKDNELNWVNGIHVDPVHRTLWVCSNDATRDNVDIFKYSLSSRKLIKKYVAPNDGISNMFNDLVIHPNGDVYISGSSTIYMISHISDKLEPFFENKAFLSSNGITLSDDGKTIYVADDANGIWKIDIKTKIFTRLTHEPDFNTYGIDGLYFSDNNLYAIQNLLVCQISKFTLNKDATHIEKCKYLEKNTPSLRAPTTGVIVDNDFYFIAGYSQKGVVVMKSPLNEANRNK